MQDKKSFSKTKNGQVERTTQYILLQKQWNSYPRPNFTKWIGRSLQDLSWPELNHSNPDYHTVFTGDTVFAVSRKYNVDMRTLVN
ncbi:MAG: hypothetical protein CM15mP62_24010 [Rhodospirillaceae bacterium]|nr:MAG: hypothetical protein CM15mP62_24010 [Rhodospirillaceae bacterium]